MTGPTSGTSGTGVGPQKWPEVPEIPTESCTGPAGHTGPTKNRTPPWVFASYSSTLAIVPHRHRCGVCGRELRCTHPACAGKTILCVCCKLDQIEREMARTA